MRSRYLLDDGFHQRLQVLAVIVHAVFRYAITRRSIDDREIELVIISIELHEQLQNLVIDIIHTLIRLINLVDDDDRLQLLLESLTQHVFRLRHRSLESIDQQQHAIDHVQDTLDLTTEIGMARGINDVDLDTIIHDGRVLRQDRYTALTLDIARVHDTLLYLLIRAENVALLQHSIHERRLAVVDMRDDSDIT